MFFLVASSVESLSKLLTGHIKPNLQSPNLPSLGQNLPSSNSNLPSSITILPSSAGQVASSLFASIPEDLKSKIENLRKKSDIEEVRSLIKDLCSTSFSSSRTLGDIKTKSKVHKRNLFKKYD